MDSNLILEEILKQQLDTNTEMQYMTYNYPADKGILKEPKKLLNLLNSATSNKSRQKGSSSKVQSTKSRQKSDANKYSFGTKTQNGINLNSD